MDNSFLPSGIPAFDYESPGLFSSYSQRIGQDDHAGMAASVMQQALEQGNWQSTGSQPLLAELDPVEADFFANAFKRNGAPETESASGVQAEIRAIEDHEGIDNNDQPLRKRTRFSQKAVRLLNSWLSTHQDDPYPSKSDVESLSGKTALTVRQIRTWFVNSRRRGPGQSHVSPPTEYAVSPPEQTESNSHNLRTPPYPAKTGHMKVDQYGGPRPALTSDSLAKLPTGSKPASSESIERYESQLETFDAEAMNTIQRAAAELPVWQDVAPRSNSADSVKSGRARSAVSSRAASNGSKSSASSMAFSIMSRTSGISKRGRKGRRRFGPSPVYLERVPQANPHQEGTKFPDKQDRGRYACTTCGKRSKERYEWRRHEATHFNEMEEWICMPNDDHMVNGRCMFCNESLFCKCHILWRAQTCLRKELRDRTFTRKDHLKQHFHHVHGLTREDLKAPRLNHAMESWHRPVAWANANLTALWCGFCKNYLHDWTTRLDHVSEHFQRGCTMGEWSSVGWECENFRDNCGLTIDGMKRMCSSLGCKVEKEYGRGYGPGLHLNEVHKFGNCGGFVFTNASQFREHLKSVHSVEFPGMNDLLCKVALWRT